ncbi:conserved hypothetical protein [Vibrio jasicida]|uniref:Chromosome partitioning protein ParA n=1 Tax=Vibrio jasicida TaxID=766224 RepID=A0AAU9QNB9_9VIBR|nr:conserved hypothetical protein [Vibrio jasicida]CAH1594550.1 conserved hypothetical protein [Vibrio jasicida]
MGQFGVAVGKSKTVLVIWVGLAWSGVTAASELINFNEQDKLNNIKSAYQQEYSALNIDENIAHYNKLNAEIESTKIKLVNNVEMIKSDSNRLTDKLVDGVYDESLMLTLRNMSSKVNSMKKEIETAGKLLAETKQQLSQDQREASQIERKKNDALLALYEKIKARHLDDSKRVINDTYQGQLQCNVSESLSTCVNRNLPSIKNAFVLSKGGLSRIQLTRFRVVDANQRLNGDLSFTADASYKHAYSANTEVELRQALNLDRVRFVFRSNSESTVFYINDQEVGSGGRVDVTGNYVGVYSVRAVNSNQTQSLKLNLKNGGDYFFPFSNKANATDLHSTRSVMEEASKVDDEATRDKHSGKFSESLLPPNAVTGMEPAVKQDVKRYTNKVLYKDDAFTYLLPQFKGNQKSHDIFLNREQATQYCERLSSRLPSTTAYQYLEKYANLSSGDYWTNKGSVYSSDKHKELDKAFDTNKFICMVSMS